LLGFSYFKEFVYMSRYDRFSTDAMEKSVFSYMHRFFNGSGSYRKYKFLLKDSGMLINSFVRLKYFMFFNIFKIDNCFVYDGEEEIFKAYNKNLYSFKSFKSMYLDRFFFVYYTNT